MKAQAVAAEEIKRGRREQEKRERRARAEEAVRARLSGGRHKHSRSSGAHCHMSPRHPFREEQEGSYEEGWDRWDGRTANREREGRVRNVNWETWDGGEEKPGESKEGKGRKREGRKGKEQRESRGRDGRGKDRRRSQKKTNDTSDNEGRTRRYRSRTASPRRKRNTEDRLQRKRSRHRSPSSQRLSGKDRRHALDDLYISEDNNDNIPRCLNVSNSPHDDLVPSSSNIPPLPIDSSSCDRNSDLYHHHTGSSAGPRHFPKSKFRSESCSRSSSRTRSMSFSSSPSSLSPGPSLPPNLPSKMDKYFKDSYDPRLDTAPLSTVPNVPATGLINDVEFEGWDAMLELIKLRRQDKEERKRLERLGLLDKKDKKGKGKDKAKLDILSVVNGSANLLDIEYKKRGSVREWDLGKEDLSF